MTILATLAIAIVAGAVILCALIMVWALILDHQAERLGKALDAEPGGFGDQTYPASGTLEHSVWWTPDGSDDLSVQSGYPTLPPIAYPEPDPTVPAAKARRAKRLP